MNMIAHLPKHIAAVLHAAGLTAQFNADMDRAAGYHLAGDEATRDRECERIMSYVAQALDCSPFSLRQMLVTVNNLMPTPSVYVAIGARLQEERERIGLHVFQMAAIGCVQAHKHTLYEAGHLELPAAYLAALERDAGIDALYVLTGRREGAAPHA